MGFEDEVEQSLGGLAVKRTVGPSGHANSPHPSSREGHHSTAAVELECSPIAFDLARLSCCCATSRVQRKSVPSTHMRCMITANRRARATIAFFIPRRLAICIAQALSQDHFVSSRQHDLGRFIEHHPHHLVAAPRYAADRAARRIDTGRALIQIRLRPPWTSKARPAHRRWRDRSAPPPGRHQGPSSGAGTPHRSARRPASGDAGCRTVRAAPAGQ